MLEITRLDHVSFAVKSVTASRRFFGEILGLQELDRPAFNFPGAWYAIGDRALHLIEQADADRADGPRLSRSDHMALEVKDMTAVRQTLDSFEIPYQVGSNEKLGFKQTFCADPDGHSIEFISFN